MGFTNPDTLNPLTVFNPPLVIIPAGVEKDYKCLSIIQDMGTDRVFAKTKEFACEGKYSLRQARHERSTDEANSI